MKEISIIADNIVSPLGSTSANNFSQLKSGSSGIRLQKNEAILAAPFYASLFGKKKPFKSTRKYTFFEQLLIASVEDALLQVKIDTTDKRTGLIISSTKGNINLLESEEITDKLKKRTTLHSSAKLVADHFHFASKPVIVSHACVSGLLGIITAMRMLQEGIYDNVVVAGADIITKFVLTGFQSFQAISDEPCKPFDAKRKGITLGEGAATVILSATQSGDIKVCSGAMSNDANHISGPSRTGKELFQAINQAMKDAGVEAKDIDMISAHGTATIYNDDMESKAINLAGLQQVPVNSLKGYYGHTLGAAGLIESVISIHSMKENMIIPTKGFSVAGTAESINVCSTLQPGSINTCLKTASGFGGCNAAVIFQKTV